jgi:hypothetical protein
MSRRIDIELTSALDDGSWTWRAAGARHPKGVVPGSVLPAGVKVGDEFKVEVEQEIDGITILGVVHGRAKAERSDVIELLPAERDFQPVVETRAPGGRRRDDDRPRRRRDEGEGRGDRRPRRDGPSRDGAPREGGGREGASREGAARDGAGRDSGRGGGGRGAGREGGRGDGDRRPRREGADRPRRGPSFTPPPEVPQRPKPQRLKPGKAHRTAVLGDLPEEQRPIAELALQGLAAVRQRVRDENQKAAAEGRATMPEASVMKIAEELLPKLRVAEWRDRAEAAQRQMANLDLRDLRSVVAAANDPIVVRDETTRALASELTEGLATRQEQELLLWFGDVDAALAVGRVVRALRLSSQPPKAGVPFPADIAQRLVDSANAALAPMDPPERWIAMLEAAAFSPVRAQIKPVRKPDVVTDDLTATVTRLAPALPQVAELFGVEVDPKASMPKPLRPGPRPGSKDAKADRSDKPRSDRKPGGDAPRDKAPREKPAEKSAAATSTAATAADQSTATSPDTADAPATTASADAPTADAAQTPAAAGTPAAAEVPAATEAPDAAGATGTDEPAETAAAAEAPEIADTADAADAAEAPHAAGATGTDEPAETAAASEFAETRDAADAPAATEARDVAETRAAADAPGGSGANATDEPAETTAGAPDATDEPADTADTSDTSAAAEAPEIAETPEATATEEPADRAGTPAAPATRTGSAPPDTQDAAAAGVLSAETSGVVETPDAAEAPESTEGPEAPESPAAPGAEPLAVDEALAELLDAAAGDQLIQEAAAVQPESRAVEAEAEAIAVADLAGDELDR